MPDLKRGPDNDVPAASLSLDKSWIYKIAVLSDLVARRVAAIASEVGGLNLSQWRVLAAVGDRNGRTASQVVDITPMDKGIVSRSVASLVQQGLLRRAASDSDGRVSHLYMTDSGREVFDRIVAMLAETGASGQALLSEAEATDFTARLDRLIQNYPSPRG
ncbi:MAG: MarR family winged helix-turn-helix transcriptional regulator [Litorimonas sp.]